MIKNDNNTANGEKTMTVEITYKSGKVESANIALTDYVDAMVQLASENRVVTMHIVKG